MLGLNTKAPQAVKTGVLSFQLLVMVIVTVAVIVLVRVGRLVHDPVSVRVPLQGFPGDRTPAGARLASRRGSEPRLTHTDESRLGYRHAEGMHTKGTEEEMV
jgi:hypothetical protein